jgi:hypothetical protein
MTLHIQVGAGQSGLRTVLSPPRRFRAKVALALFAVIGTSAIAKRAFGRREID